MRSPLPAPFDFDAHFRARTLAALAPMEEVTDAPFRALCRSLGATVAYTEFVHAEHLRDGDALSRARMDLSRDPGPTAVQIYGADPEALALAARAADEARPAFIDINCGCWVPRVVARGAGGAWLRDPDAMVAMAARVVRAVSRPVTVKTRIGWGPESQAPIADLARRLEDAGVRAITVHCRTVKQGYEGAADWSHAARAQRAVSIPVLVNGDIRSAADARRALDETGCAGVMIGRRAIEHPWIFREARALLDTGKGHPKPTATERFAACRAHASALASAYEERAARRALRRFLPGYLRGISADPEVLAPAGSLEEWCERLDACEQRHALEGPARRGRALPDERLDEALDPDEALPRAFSRRRSSPP